MGRTYEKKYSSPVDENSNENNSSSSTTTTTTSKKSDKNDNKIAMNEKFIRTERSYGKTSRSIRLPQGIDTDTIHASIDNGVLNISIPKPEEKQYTQLLFFTSIFIFIFCITLSSRTSSKIIVNL